MKIERVDDKTVKCFISNEELEEYDITYKDFVLRSEKAKEIVEDIIEQAIEEVGYKPPQFAMDMQIMMIPEKGMVLTLSEKIPEDVKNDPALQAYIQEIRKKLEGHLQDIAEQVKNPQKQLEDKAKEKEQAQEASTFTVFRFASIRDLSDYAKSLPRTLRVDSSLYKLGGRYYLYLQRGGASYERYTKACVQALEYGELWAAFQERVLYLQEHAECLIEQKAVSKLRL